MESLAVYLIFTGGTVMKRVYVKYFGIDVHKKIVVSCFLNGNKQEIRELGTSKKIYWSCQSG